MGIGRFVLELPTETPAAAAVRLAAADLGARGRRRWSHLELQTMLTHPAPGVSTFTFTYWEEAEAVSR